MSRVQQLLLLCINPARKTTQKVIAYSGPQEFLTPEQIRRKLIIANLISILEIDIEPKRQTDTAIVLYSLPREGSRNFRYRITLEEKHEWNSNS